MTVRRLTRAALHRQDNDSQVAGYARTLRAIFDDWLEHSKAAGLSVRGLAARLQQAAAAHYQAAYLRGKRQAYPAAELDERDRAWITAALAQNRDHVERALAGDIIEKAGLQRMLGGDLGALRRAFGARVQQQYGGQLWRVTEAGYLAGVRDLAAALRLRFRLPLRQEDDQDDDDAAIVALAVLLGLTAASVRRALAAAQPPVGDDLTITIMVRVADLATATSATTMAVARELGVPPATLADAASAATQEAAGGSQTEDDALAQAMGEEDVTELAPRLRAPGFRMGVEYIAEDDSSTCADCRAYSEGGENGGSIYWEPDEPPLPGSGRCGGNCRCVLAAVYEFGGAAAAA